MLWTLLSVRQWEQLRHQCGWTQADYLDRITLTAKHALLRS
ncbi:hypothetical protein [Primorskyibacter sp. 2E233]